MTFSISTLVPVTASAVTARPHGLHSNVSSGNSAWNAVRASCIVSPQHGQATYWYSRIFDYPRTRARPAAGTVCKIWPIWRQMNARVCRRAATDRFLLLGWPSADALSPGDFNHFLDQLTGEDT